MQWSVLLSSLVASRPPTEPFTLEPHRMKYLQRIVVTDTFDDGGTSGSIQNGWAWYNGI